MARDQELLALKREFADVKRKQFSFAMRQCFFRGLQVGRQRRPSPQTSHQRVAAVFAGVASDLGRTPGTGLGQASKARQTLHGVTLKAFEVTDCPTREAGS